MQTLRSTSHCKIIWATIAFKFNEDKIDYLQNYAKQLGVDSFQLTKSTKFGSIYPIYGINDPLQPSDKYISTTKRFEREVIDFTNRKTPVSKINLQLYKDIQQINNIIPLCAIGNKGLYIDARGRLFPCCWVANRYNHNNEWQTLAEKFNLNTSTLEQVLADTFWTTEFQSFRWQECRTKCEKTVVNQEYATSW